MYLTQKTAIESAREMFYRNPIAQISDIRPEVLASWQRSWDYGVNPEHVHKIVLTSRELADRIEANHVLYETAVPVVEDMYNFVKGSGFMCMLTDTEGFVLKIIGDDRVLDAAQTNLLVEGANRSEKSFGTCGIGTCIHLQRPVQIWAGEHYYKPNHIWSGSAAPVFDENKALVGILCLTGFWDCVNIHTLGLVASAAKAASRQLLLENTRHNADNTRHNLERVIEILDHGIVFIRQDGTIVQVNTPAVSMLDPMALGKGSLLGRNIGEYLTRTNKSASFGELYPGQRFTIKSTVGRLQCSFAYMPGGPMGEGDELILTIRKDESEVPNFSRCVTGSRARYTWSDLIGDSPIMEKAKNLARIAAPYPSNILLRGDSGVGKEVFAQAIHNASDRANAPFVAINCGALPRSLVESELFGYEGGAFTGSKRDGQPGKFEMANGGTIFLDEIGDMPLDVQVLLLRVLQTREVTRIGARSSSPVDVRIISATNKDLQKCVREGAFREDLYYRLNVFAVAIPSLKERKEDIRQLADHMLNKFAAGFHKHIDGFTDDAYRALEQHDWPGNLRELENAIERAILVSQDNLIRPEDFPAEIFDSYQCSDSEERNDADGKQCSENYEKQLIQKAVDVHRGNLTKIANELGIGRTTLYRKLKRYNIEIELVRRS